MKVSRVEKAYLALLAVIFGGIVLHAPISVSLGVLFPEYELVIKAWKELLMLVATVLAVVVAQRRGLWRELLDDWIIRVIAIYGALHVVLVAALYQGAAATFAGLAIDLRYVLFFGLVYVAVKAVPQFRWWIVRIGTVGAFIVVGFAALQLFLPPDILAHIGYSKETITPYLTVDKNPDYVRVNSTLRGPNPLGAYAGMVLAFLLAALTRGRLRLEDKRVRFYVVAFALFSSIALWVSYSRSAWVAGIVAVFAVLAVTVFRRLPRRAWIVCCVVVVAVAGALIAARGSEFVSNVVLHENPNGGSAISSNDGHVESLETGVGKMAQQPLGAGVGSTGSASLFGSEPIIIENQYLFVAHETGWFGLALFVSLYGLVLLRAWRGRSDWLSLGVFASGIGQGLIGLLLPVWADDTVSIVWWGIAAVAIGGSHGRKQTK